MKRFSIYFIIILLNVIPRFLYSQENWFWQNPSACGWGANASCFVNSNTGWIVSFAGTVMKTTNGGINFVDQNTTFDGTLLGVKFFDANTGYVFGAGGEFHKTTNGGTNWTKINNTIGQYLTDSYFFDVNTGWICGYNGTLVKTTNGGVNWITGTSGVTSQLTTISFLNANSGIAAGWNNALIKTTNAGLNWFSIAPSGSNTFQEVYYSSADTFYAGNSTAVMRTTNGGQNWTQQTLPASITVYSIKFFENAKTGIVVGCAGMMSYVLKTTNAGENWQTLYTGPYAQNISTSFVNPNTIICAGTKNTVGGFIFYFSTNGGNNWTNYTPAYYFNDTPGSIYFINQNTGFVTSTFQGLHRTTDGGSTWINDTIPINASYLKVKFINQYTGFACGSYRVILKTTNSGLNWTQVNHEYDPSGLGTLSFPSENTGYAFGGQLIMKTTNGGTNWFDVLTSSYAYNSGCFINDNTGWSCYQGNIIKTTNGGANWSNVYSGGGVFYDIAFANADTGWACGTGGNVGITTNGGLNWTGVATGQTGSGCYLKDLEFLNSKTGFVGGSGGFLAYTTNSGMNWYRQSIHMGSYQLFSVCFINSMTGWFAGYAGFIKKTTNGGYVPIGIEPIGKMIPENYCLSQNYPNPFNPVTKIRFDIAENGKWKNQNGLVTLKVYNILGEEVATLVNEKLQPGSYEVTLDATGFGSGVYFYQLTAGEILETRRMVLLK